MRPGNSGANLSLFVSECRELLRLIRLLPETKRAPALTEARETIKSRLGVSNPEQIVHHFKELASKLGYLRMITPKGHQSVRGSATYVLRDGRWVQSAGETKGTRVTDGILSMDEAMSRNARDFKRLFGREKGKNMLF